MNPSGDTPPKTAQHTAGAALIAQAIFKSQAPLTEAASALVLAARSIETHLEVIAAKQVQIAETNATIIQLLRTQA